MIFTTNQIQQILEAGGSLILDASKWTPPQLDAMITAAAANKAVTITLRRSSQIVWTHLVALASLAPGQITFDMET